jgi:hypothetical protein
MPNVFVTIFPGSREASGAGVASGEAVPEGAAGAAVILASMRRVEGLLKSFERESSPGAVGGAATPLFPALGANSVIAASGLEALLGAACTSGAPGGG